MKTMIAVMIMVFGLTVVAKGGTNIEQGVHHNVDAMSLTHLRLVQSIATIQTVYEDTQKSGQIQRRHLGLVGAALPWRNSLQPSCLRPRDDQRPPQPSEPWPAVSDAPALRTLLTDQVPEIRALAAEALATLHQPEDLPRLAKLLTDSAEAPMELLAPTVGQFVTFRDLVEPGPDAVTRYTWHKSCVASHAAWAVHLMLGECCPEPIAQLRLTHFNVSSSEHAPFLSDAALSNLKPLMAGDPKDHLWYWQEYIHRSLHQVEDATPSRAKQEWIKSFSLEMRPWPDERRAMVRLMASDVHQGGADMAYYDTPYSYYLLFNGPLDLGIEKARIYELLDGVRLWPDEQRCKGGRSQVVERLAMGWRECFTAEDIPRLLALFSNSKGDLWWSARAALVVALANLMPATHTASDDPASAEGFLRRTLKGDSDVFIRKRAASELMRRDIDLHWPLLANRFFEDRDNGDDLPGHILEWLTKAPAGVGPTQKLIALVSDERYRPLWLESESRFGKGVRGGKCRRLACEALKVRVGHSVVSDEDITALKDAEKGSARLQLILTRLHELGSPTVKDE